MGRMSLAEQAAEVLRTAIIEGDLRPGDPLSDSDPDLMAALSVSRNTLREAFRLLGHEGLLVLELHRGVRVRDLTEDDLHDIYAARRVLELTALRHAALHPGAADPAAVRAAVAEGLKAAEAGDWTAVGSANMHFHQAVVALHGSPRLNRTMRQLLAEGRLAFHSMTDPGPFHEPYLARNKEIAALLDRGAFDEAADRMADYLDQAERQLTEGFRDRPPAPRRPRSR
ncbi:GntR family transcriptional regulator [Actinomadura logoneensis]|uniref:GntR family transcriptional regulator n=2 Tax=Actinomadura logoneensis TaxID=2293572 RepID=A0A372JSG8_9ACTN|nr:GntR family transcriptional regulator [Actinomadura logoneensis]